MQLKFSPSLIVFIFLLGCSNRPLLTYQTKDVERLSSVLFMPPDVEQGAWNSDSYKVTTEFNRTISREENVADEISARLCVGSGNRRGTRYDRHSICVGQWVNKYSDTNSLDEKYDLIAQIRTQRSGPYADQLIVPVELQRWYAQCGGFLPVVPEFKLCNFNVFHDDLRITITMRFDEQTVTFEDFQRIVSAVSERLISVGSDS